jgi:hypothetical protein
VKWSAPAIGDRRNVTRFLFLPKTLSVNNSSHYETRWLCFVRIRQIWHYEWLNDTFVE